jgi:hypothetical protein
MSPGGFIYAIGASDTALVTVGSTRTRVEERRNLLQRAYPFPVRIVATVFVATHVRRVASRIQVFLAEHRHRGAWFETPMDVERLTALVARATAVRAPAGAHPTQPLSPGRPVMIRGDRVKAQRQALHLTQRA